VPASMMPVVVENSLAGGTVRRRPPLKAEAEWAQWNRRRTMRAELHALDADLQNNLNEVSILRASAKRRRELAQAERDAGRPQHGRRFDAEADTLEYRAGRRERAWSESRSRRCGMSSVRPAPARLVAGCVVAP
jgi:hypothetical protein